MIEAIVAVPQGLLVTGFLAGVVAVMALATRRDERELRLQSSLAERAARGPGRTCAPGTAGRGSQADPVPGPQHG